MGSERPKKIAVLGGGIASLTAVERLTAEPDWQSRYDITVYQMGWRLGGKGASGRARDKYDRIEEHGYHMWFGFYDQAFNLIKRVYHENARPLDVPLAVWSEAFKPVNYWVTVETFRDKHGEIKHKNWPLEFMPNAMVPGHPSPKPSLFALAVRACRWSVLLFKSLHQTASFSINDDEFTMPNESFFHAWWTRWAADAEAIVCGIFGRWLYRVLGWLNHKRRSADDRNRILEFPQNVLEKLQGAIEKAVMHHLESRRMWILSDFIEANIRGCIFDGVLFKNDFNVINGYDYREWLKRHGATEFTLQSPIVQGFYALVFAGTYYTFEAGTALKATLELLLNYKGSVYWKMQAGMGEVVFSPIYEVLKKRGVKFRFFHRVTEVKPSADGKSIGSIKIGRQVTLKSAMASPEYREYDPLITVRGLPCWPTEPLYEQIVEGEELKKRNINLESSWSTWKDIESITLEAGRDFDQVILGISIGALPHICREIIAAKTEWQAMVDNVKAIPTMGIQLWMYPDIAGLGSKMWRNEICLFSTYVEPCDTWADKSELLMRESWPASHMPNSIAYITGPMKPKPHFELQPFSETCFPCHAREVVKGYTRDFLKRDAKHLWPRWIDCQTGEPRWELLVDPKDGTGEYRLDPQYFRANIDPTEHYVMTMKGSSRYRLQANESGYENLVLTGDWTHNPLNVGCIEAAVISGIYAANTILGKPLEVANEPVGPMSFMMTCKKKDRKR